MSDLLTGLEGIGLGDLSGMDIYAVQDKKGAVNTDEDNVKHEEFHSEEEFLLDKTFQCPVCGKSFKSKVVKTGRTKVESMDTDLRPKYKYIDPVKYDAIVCTNCGYAALSRYFSFMTATFAKIIKENISSNFINTFKDESTYSYDVALTRYKLALLNSVMKRAKNSEKAYTCLKIAWLIRGKAEKISIYEPGAADKIRNLKKEEMDFIEKAYEGFENAFASESFPMCGMDEATCTYVVADLARRTERYTDAKKLVGKVILSKSANERIKNKARELKQLIGEESKF